MIRISKPATAPAILRNRGAAETRANQQSFLRHIEAYRNGTRKFEFKSNIYGAKSVKSALLRAQSDKCAFCESKFTHIAYGDVEHYRPKGGYKQLPQDRLSKLGYYWLAYDWSNFFASCQLCNQRFKGNLFPLANEQMRAKDHRDDESLEDALLIDPGDTATDPEHLVRFRGHVCHAEDKYGKTTIDVVGLNRDELKEQRLAHLQLLWSSFDLAKLPQVPKAIRERAKKVLAASVRTDAEYSAAVKTAIADKFEYVPTPE